MSQAEVLQFLRSGDMRGMVEVDLECSETLRRRMWKFPPIFVKKPVSMDMLDERQAELARASGRFKQPEVLLLNAFTATRLVVSTPLLRYYLNELGVTCTRVYRVLQFNGSGSRSEQ